jgi:transaldolase
MSKSQLDQLREMTTVVADTADFDLIRSYLPIDATTNPSLVMQAANKPQYKPLLDRAFALSKRASNEEKQQELFIDTACVLFGSELLKIIPGRVSTEVDAALSFDTEKSVERALRIISLYKEFGIPKERVLIKLAATWEGIKAGQILELDDIHCNMTLIFCLEQAIACAEAGATLVSPFVGRILDWHKAHYPSQEYTTENDPGVLSTKRIYNYLKKFGFKTNIMGASFRSVKQVLALAGCDLLTISPALLEKLSQDQKEVPQQLSIASAVQLSIPHITITEPSFRFALNENAMAGEKLAEGIRLFVADTRKLGASLTSYTNPQK